MERNEERSVDSLVEEIVSTFAPGDIIPHAWLRARFGIKDKLELRFRDYGNEEAYLFAIGQLEIQYSTRVRGLLDRLLEARHGWLVNRPGEGYMICPTMSM